MTRAAPSGLLLVGALLLVSPLRSIEVPGQVGPVVPVDLDGDGRRDLAVGVSVGSPPAASHTLALYRQRGDGSFALKPDITVDVPTGVVAVDSGPYGETGERLFVLSEVGVGALEVDFAIPWAEIRPVLDVALPTLLAAETGPVRIDFARAEGFLVPTLPHPRFLGRNGQVVVLDHRPETRLAVGRGAGRDRLLLTTAEIPLPAIADQDTDGAEELVLVAREEVRVFELGPGPDRPRPPSRVDPVHALSEAERDDVRTRGLYRLADLRGQGLLDLVVFVWSEAGVLELGGRTLLFRAGGDGRIPAEPTQVLDVPHPFYGLARLLDLDGDGRLELAVPSVEIGLWGYVRYLTSRKASFDLYVYHLGDDGRFDPRPTVIQMQIALSDTLDLPVLDWADGDGDGVLDLLVGSDRSRICLFPGRALDGGGWRHESRSSACASEDPYRRVEAADLDGDGAVELVVSGGRGGDGHRFTVHRLARP